MDLGRLDARLCHKCKQLRHIARNCPNPRVDAAAVLPLVVVVAKVDLLVAHRTDKAVCAGCSKPEHTIAQWWKEHPTLMPEAIRAKRKSTNMAAHAKMKKRAILSPEYQF